MLRCFLIFGLLFSCSISIRVLAEPSADDLKKIKTDINNTKANIKLSEKQHDDASTELAKLETSLGAIQKQKQALSRAIKEQEKELSSLKTEERRGTCSPRKTPRRTTECKLSLRARKKHQNAVKPRRQQSCLTNNGVL